MELAEQTSFVGRVWELDELRTLMSRFRMVTLTGAGGCGKSRLAYRLAQSLPVQNLSIIELSGVNDPALLPGVVAHALGAPDSAGSNPIPWLLDNLGREPALLVWDNCEHLAEACSELAATLLATRETVQLLCTSRQPLRVPGEKAWIVPSLSFPTADSTATAIGEFESVRLFIDRAAAASPGFRLTGANALAIAGICSRLEGIPLAVELAAARVNVLAPTQILAMLDDALSLLKSHGGFVERQRTLESTLDWSYRLLSEFDRNLFRRIGVFAGSFDIDAVVGVCGDSRTDPRDIIDALGSLIDRSLVVADTSRDLAEYHLLDAVRQYALKLLKASGEEVGLRHAHMRHYIALAKEAEPHLIRHRDQAMWLDRLDQRLPDIRAALTWAFATEPARGAELAALLGWFWWFRAYLAEGNLWIRRAREAAVGDPALMAAAIRFEGHLAAREGDNSRVATRALEALHLYRGLDDDRGAALSLFLMGTSARSLGHYSRARVLIEASLRIEERLGDALRANMVGELGVVSMLLGDWRSAEKAFRTAAALQRANGDRWSLALTLANWAELNIRRGQCGMAAPLVLESIATMRQMEDSFTLVQLLDYAGMISIAAGSAQLGIRLIGRADCERVRLQMQQTQSSRDLTESWVERAEGLIGATAVRQALDEGQKGQFQEWLSLAADAIAAPPKPTGGLSRREWQVAELIAGGMTNREIAQRLFISARTAEGHVLQILNKLGFQRRSQIASWVSREKVSSVAEPKNR